MYLKEVLFILELKKITLADRPLFESYLSRPDQRGSECAFTNLFVWQDCYGIYWTVVHDFLVIKVKRNEVDFFLQPFGGKDEDLPKLFAEIKEIMKATLLRSMVFMTMAKSGWQKLFQRWNLLKIVIIGIMFISVKNWLVCLGVNIM